MGISKAAMKRKGIHLKTVTVKKTAEELIFASQHHVNNTKPVTFNYSNRSQTLEVWMTIIFYFFILHINEIQ